MKKSLLSALAFFFIGFALVAQPCTPDGSLTAPGIYPDSITNLPPGTVNVYYEAVISAVIPTDTVYMGLTAQIDSIGVTGVSGLPTGLSWVTDSPSNYWDGGTSGCLKIFGTTSIQGIHPIMIYLSIHGELSGMPLTMPDTIEFYKIDMQTASVNEFNGQNFLVGSAFPNPANDVTTIEVNSAKPQFVTFTLFNLVGTQITESKHQLTSGQNLINVAVKLYPSGMYYFRISDGNQTITRKLNIAH